MSLAASTEVQMMIRGSELVVKIKLIFTGRKGMWLVSEGMTRPDPSLLLTHSK